MGISFGSDRVVREMVARWDAENLDAEFTNKRPEPTDHYPVLHDTEAQPQPGSTAFPYCVFEQSPGFRGAHQSFGDASSRQLRTTNWQFRVYATDDFGATGKEMAAQLANSIMQAFDNYCAEGIVLVQHQNDYGLRPQDSQSEWAWVINYLIFYDAVVNR